MVPDHQLRERPTGLSGGCQNGPDREGRVRVCAGLTPGGQGTRFPYERDSSYVVKVVRA